MDCRLCLCDGEALARYGFGQGHPFGPDRLSAFRNEFRARGLDTHEGLCLYPPASADAADLRRFHSPGYVARVREASVTGEGYLDCGDTPAFAGVYEAAATVVGSVLEGARRIMRGECARAFIPIAGLHHASRDSAAGFCVFNDCGVLIETLFDVYALERVAYVDIDAHHGDGVFYAFESDPRLIYADMHEDGHHLYPGTGHAYETGTGDARGSKLNIPLPPGADDALFMRLWPALESFVREARPQFILLQCGADSMAGDPITHLALSERAHAHAATHLAVLADELCAGRLLAMGGGGYNRGNLARAWSSVVAALLA